MKELKLDQFYDYLFLSELSYAPDGKSAACVAAKADPSENAYTRNIWLYRDDEWCQLTAGGAEQGYFWEDESHLLFPAARSKAEKDRAAAGGQSTAFYRISTKGGEAVPAFTLPFAAVGLKRFDEHRLLVLGRIDANDPDYYKKTEEERAASDGERKENADYEVVTELPYYANGGGYVDRKRTALFLYDTESDRTERISAPLCDVASVTVLDKTVYFVGAEYDNIATYLDGEIYRYDPVSGACVSLGNGGFSLTACASLSGKLIAAASIYEEYATLPENEFYEVEPVSGAFTRFAHNADSLGNSTGSDCRLGATHYLREKEDGVYFTKTMGGSCRLSRLCPDGSVEEITAREGSVDDFDVSPDGTVLLIGLYDNTLQEVYEQGTDGTMKKVSSFNDKALQDTYVAALNPLSVTSCGYDIDGWVLLPKDYDEGKTYPAILDIHGGPTTAYGPLFFHEMQYWAGQGYFVFFCNPKGSSGKGHAFADICGQYGTTDFQNLMDFTDAVLAAYPRIDPARVGCTGGSYGGFMSNWILGHTNRFAAIATQRSISNWISFCGVSDCGWFFCEEQLGTDLRCPDGTEKLWAMSPLKYLENMQTPTLVLHSTEDYRCPLEQGMQLYTALKEKGVPTRMVLFHGENHELSRSGKPKHRVRRLLEITQWMDAWLKEKHEES